MILIQIFDVSDSNTMVDLFSIKIISAPYIRLVFFNRLIVRCAIDVSTLVKKYNARSKVVDKFSIGCVLNKKLDSPKINHSSALNM